MIQEEEEQIFDRRRPKSILKPPMNSYRRHPRPFNRTAVSDDESEESDEESEEESGSYSLRNKKKRNYKSLLDGTVNGSEVSSVNLKGISKKKLYFKCIFAFYRAKSLTRVTRNL